MNNIASLGFTVLSQRQSRKGDGSMYRHGTDVAFRAKEPLLRGSQPSLPHASIRLMFIPPRLHRDNTMRPIVPQEDCETRETSCHSRKLRGEKISGIILKNLIFPFVCFLLLSCEIRNISIFLFFHLLTSKLELELEINLPRTLWTFARFHGERIICNVL